MAHVKDIGVTGVTFDVDTDLSTKQFYFVSAASTVDRIVLGTAGCEPTPLGVLQTDDGDTIGDAVEVSMFGPTKVWAEACGLAGEACPIGFWDALVCASNGKARRAGSNSAVNAFSMATIATACNTAIISIWLVGPVGACSVAAS